MPYIISKNIRGTYNEQSKHYQQCKNRVNEKNNQRTPHERGNAIRDGKGARNDFQARNA